MGNIKLKDVLKIKRPGDEWYALEAPEQLHFWTKTHKWHGDIFRENKLAIVAIKIESKKQTGKGSVDKWKWKNPMRLKCGVELTGQFGTIATKKAIFEGRLDSIIELNEVMLELCELTGFTVWEVKRLEVYHARKGAGVKFSRHNPDGTGTSLYVAKVFRDSNERWYHQVVINEQQEILGNFKNNVAHCTASEFVGIDFSCAIEKKIKKKQIKMKKSTS